MVIETRLARRARRACSSRRTGGSAPSPRPAPRSARSCSGARCAPRSECPRAHRSSCSARVLRAPCEAWARPRRRLPGVMRPRRGRVLDALRGPEARDAFQHREPFAGPVMLDGENSPAGQADDGWFRNRPRLRVDRRRRESMRSEDAPAKIRWRSLRCGKGGGRTSAQARGRWFTARRGSRTARSIPCPSCT